MTLVVYCGPYTEGVDLVLPSGASKFCPHGEDVDVPDVLAQNLLKQEIWAKPKSRPTTKEKE